jgi:hypothetical protein
MMKFIVVPFLIVGLVCISTNTCLASGGNKSNLKEIEATTEDGRKVVLFPDGTWEHKESTIIPKPTIEDKFSNKPPNASE